jgi:hypothetical protein
MEIKNPNLDTACFGRTPLPMRSLASNGPAKACAIDKIEQFQAELKAADTDAEERLMALKFVMHFVGDIHQPLHSSDNGDRGGNDIKIVADGFHHTSKDELHGFWDAQFVDAHASEHVSGFSHQRNYAHTSERVGGRHRRGLAKGSIRYSGFRHVWKSTLVKGDSPTFGRDLRGHRGKRREIAAKQSGYSPRQPAQHFPWIRTDRLGRMPQDPDQSGHSN